MTLQSRTSIGGILVNAIEGWRFSDRDGVVVGKCPGDPGVLRIFTVPPNRLAAPVTHEQGLRHAAEFARVQGLAAYGRQLMESVTGPYGSATYYRGKDDIFIWYCTRAAGLIIGIYACPKALARNVDHSFVRRQCARMISSAVFDRTKWGADDQLTRFLAEQLGDGTFDEFGEPPKIIPKAPDAPPTDP